MSTDGRGCAGAPVTEIAIRRFRDADAEATARVFFAAVRVGTADHYAEAQRRAWCPALPEGPDWRARLAGPACWVAVSGGEVVGFMTLDRTGYIDLAFVHPDHAGAGVGARLYAMVEEAARADGVERLSVKASLAAQPFFARHGFVVIRENAVALRGAVLANVTMEKPLSGAPAPAASGDPAGDPG